MKLNTATLLTLILVLPLLLMPVTAEAGTCVGGVWSGRSCYSNYECGSCDAGTWAGFACSSSSQCGRYCFSGPYRWRSCSTSADCDGYSCVTASCKGYCSPFFSAAVDSGEKGACAKEEAAAAIFQ